MEKEESQLQQFLSSSHNIFSYSRLQFLAVREQELYNSYVQLWGVLEMPEEKWQQELQWWQQRDKGTQRLAMALAWALLKEE
jgi:hypothetical protein